MHKNEKYGMLPNLNSKNQTVSVVIPVRGKLKLLSRALNSCITQTLYPTEIVLVDDSDDAEDKKMVEAIASSFKNFIQAAKVPTTFIFKTSGGGAGASSARNLGIQHSKSNFIAFLDADDYFLPDKLATQVSAMVNSDADISHTNYLIRNRETGISRVADTSFNHGYKQDSVITFRDCSIATPTVMIKKSLINGHFEVFPNGVIRGEDLVAWARLCQLSSKPLLHVAETLTVVEVNADSSASSSANTKLAKIHLAQHAKIFNIKPLKIHEYGGLKTFLIGLIPLPPKVIGYLLNLLRALRGH